MEKTAVGAVTMIFLVVLLLCALVYEVRENSAKARELKDLRELVRERENPHAR